MAFSDGLFSLAEPILTLCEIRSSLERQVSPDND